MNLTRSTQGAVAVVHIGGDLIGEDNGPRVVEAAVQALQENIRTCVLDISGLRYINSSGIGVLITILTKFRNQGGEVYLMNPSDRIKKLLAITKLNAIFQTVASVDEAAEKTSR
jgi:anti-sigma B factor antagonist